MFVNGMNGMNLGMNGMRNISVTRMGDYLTNGLTKTVANKLKIRCGEPVLYWYTSDVAAMTFISSWTVWHLLVHEL